MAKAARGKGGRFVRAGRAIKRKVKKGFNLARGAPSTGVMGALNRPVSRMVAPAIAVTALAELVLTPIPNGQGGSDAWYLRLAAGWKNYVASGKTDPTLILATDEQGNNAITIGMMQLKQNILPAVGTGLLAALVGWAGRKVGA